MELPCYPVFFLLFMALAFVFGIGYYWVSRDIHKNHDIVWMGIIAKLMVFIGVLWAGIVGQIHFMLVGSGTVDLIFSILFIEFLKSYKTSTT